MKLLITGGAGFIGSNFVHYWLENHKEDQITVLDALTYAGNIKSLEPFLKQINFIHGSILDETLVNKITEGIDTIVHFAAESHNDRAIADPFIFTKTNVVGTHILLEAARKNKVKRFHHISTDEVYGDIPLEENYKFNELTRYNPRSPYSASKAGSDHLVNAYFHTYNLPITISNCTNNFGAYQHPEKFIPRVIIRALQNQTIPIYGNGAQVRDWLFVKDHCRAIDMILSKGQIGQTYSIGGMTQSISNLEVVKQILKILKLPESQIEYVADRPGHDLKYAVDWSKIQKELGWKPEHNFEDYLQETVKWYIDNKGWWESTFAESENFYKK